MMYFFNFCLEQLISVQNLYIYWLKFRQEKLYSCMNSSGLSQYKYLVITFTAVTLVTACYWLLMIYW